MKTRCKLSEKYGSDFQKVCNSKFCKICEYHIKKAMANYEKARVSKEHE